MTLTEIKQAVESGQTVHWGTSYVVIKDKLGQWFIKFIPNNHCIGLTQADGTTLNGRPEDFSIAKKTT